MHYRLQMVGARSAPATVPSTCSLAVGSAGCDPVPLPSPSASSVLTRGSLETGLTGAGFGVGFYRVDMLCVRSSTRCAN